MSSMTITILGSGSKGNAFIIEHEDSVIMIDAGFMLNDILSRLESANIAIASIQALFISHGHSDHARGIMDLNRYVAIPVYMTENLFLASTGANKTSHPAWLDLDKNQAVFFKEWDNIRIGSITVTPVPVSHDSVSPVGFIIKAGNEKLALVTDAGAISGESKDAMKDSNIIMLESNYDHEMLWKSQRHFLLKKRISGPTGHLSNQKSAEILSEIISPGTSDVVLLHLSQECNTPELAVKSAMGMNRSLKDGAIKLHVAEQNEVIRLSVKSVVHNNRNEVRI